MKAETLARVYTHTYNLINKKINIKQRNKFRPQRA